MRFRLALLHVALPLALGAASYLALRSHVPLLGAHAALWPHAPRLIHDCFADAAWGWAVGGFVSTMWIHQERAYRAAWVAIAAAIAATFELLQSTRIVGGAFDVRDLVVQTIAIAIAGTMVGGMHRWTTPRAAR